MHKIGFLMSLYIDFTGGLYYLVGIFFLLKMIKNIDSDIYHRLYTTVCNIKGFPIKVYNVRVLVSVSVLVLKSQ